MGIDARGGGLRELLLGLLLEEDGYRFVAFQDESGEWKPPAERMYRKRTLPEWLTVTQYVENDAPRLTSAEDELRPDLVFFSSGETTPFRLEFTVGQDTEGMHVLASDGITGVRWHKPGESEED